MTQKRKKNRYFPVAPWTGTIRRSDALSIAYQTVKTWILAFIFTWIGRFRCTLACYPSALTSCWYNISNRILGGHTHDVFVCKFQRQVTSVSITPGNMVQDRAA